MKKPDREQIERRRAERYSRVRELRELVAKGKAELAAKRAAAEEPS